MKTKPYILAEFEEALAIYKPAGLMVHADGRNDEPTLADWILINYPALSDVGEKMEVEGKEIARPGIVHRLDKDTSGVLLVAKNHDAYLFLKKQFMGRKVEKLYEAFVYGALKKKDGLINKPIGKSSEDFRKFAVPPKIRGEERAAETIYRVKIQGKDGALLEVEPKTGRTHQIRVHMLSIGHPVVSDPLYASTRKGIYGFKRLALHAKKVSWRGEKGERREVEAPYPSDFGNALEEIMTETEIIA